MLQAVESTPERLGSEPLLATYAVEVNWPQGGTRPEPNRFDSWGFGWVLGPHMHTSQDRVKSHCDCEELPQAAAGSGTELWIWGGLEERGQKGSSFT